MTLCPDCACKHRAEIEFAATIIDVELAGRRKSQAAADLRAMIQPKQDARSSRTVVCVAAPKS